MTGPTIFLEIVTPDGIAVQEPEVELVVLHRREARFEVGSQIAVFPRHGPMLVRMPVAPVRYHQRGRAYHLAVGGGFAEIRNNRVRIVSPWVERVAADARHPAATAAEICHAWLAGVADSGGALLGYQGRSP